MTTSARNLSQTQFSTPIPGLNSVPFDRPSRHTGPSAVIKTIRTQIASTQENINRNSVVEKRPQPDRIQTYHRLELGSSHWVLISDEPGLPVLEARMVGERFNPPSLPIAFSYRIRSTSPQERYQEMVVNSNAEGLWTTIYGVSIWSKREDVCAER